MRHIVSALAFVLGAAAAGCSVERQVLDNPEQVAVSCEGAWQLGLPRAPCAFTDHCDRPTSDDPECCVDYAYCTAEGLQIDTVCQPGCRCEDDSGCVWAEEICVDTRCDACPSTDLCPRCPQDWLPLTRNGCPSCQCAPPGTCEEPGAACGDGVICYPGGSCAEGCDPSQPGCCANACAAEGCLDPAPLGCYIPCPQQLGCEVCATAQCACEGEQWFCDAVCVEDLFFTCDAS